MADQPHQPLEVWTPFVIQVRALAWQPPLCSSSQRHAARVSRVASRERVL